MLAEPCRDIRGSQVARESREFVCFIPSPEEELIFLECGLLLLSIEQSDEALAGLDRLEDARDRLAFFPFKECFSSAVLLAKYELNASCFDLIYDRY